MKCSKVMFRIFSIILLLVFVSIPQVFGSNSYTISVKLDYKNFELYGNAEIKFKNDSSKKISSIFLLLYPNAHLAKSSYLNDVNFTWIYPDNFSKGSMQINSITSLGDNLSYQYVKRNGLPKDVLIEVSLNKELGPAESTELIVSYSVKIPKKFGPFGHYRKDILLNGGFYPIIPSLSRDGEWLVHAYPDKADYKLFVEGRGDFLINGKEVKTSDSGKVEVDLPGADYITLFNTGKLIEREVAGKKVKVRLFFHKKEDGIFKQLLSDTNRFLDFVERQKELESIDADIAFCEGYLRDRLIQPSDGVLYFSDRLYKLFYSLRGYHSIEIVRGLFYELFRSKLRGKEDYFSYDWVINTLAWYYTEAFINDYHSRIKRDARDIKLVRLFSFLPQLDQVIYAPQFSFAQAYYNQIYAYDPFRLDVLDYNNRILSKRVVYEKMKDIYGSTYDLKIFFTVYLEGEVPFVRAAEDFFGADSIKIFELWLGSYPLVNYFLKDIKRKKLDDGSYDNSILIGKESKIEIEEPVNIYLEEWGGKSHLVRLSGKEKEERIEIHTENRLRTVHIDPQGRLLESKLGDNRSPNLYKLILTDYNLGIDLNGLSTSVSFSIQFRKLYGSYNRYNFSGYRDSASYGASVGYVRLFGKFLDRLRLSHGAGIYYNIDGLSSDYIVFRPGIDDPSSPLQVTVNPKGIATSIMFYYFFGNQISYTNPKEGMGATFYVGIGSKYLGGDFDYYKTGLDCSGVVPIDQNNILALRFEFGISGNNGIPPQQQFFLGGINVMKGFMQGEIDRVGRNRILFSAEYRHYLLKDIDINLGSIFRVRNIMGALFTDAGRVSGSVAEYADSIAKGTTFDSSPHHLFNIKKYDTDIGYGIRFLYDVFGVRETILSIDAAKSLSNFRDNGVRFYISFAHSF